MKCSFFLSLLLDIEETTADGEEEEELVAAAAAAEEEEVLLLDCFFPSPANNERKCDERSARITL